jgi:hypothetical protein
MHLVDRAAVVEERAEQRDDLADGLLLHEARVLQRHADPLPDPLRARAAPFVAEHAHAPRGLRLQALADLDRSGLAGAVRPEQPEGLAARDLQRQTVDRDDLAAAAARELLAQLIDLDGEHAQMVAAWRAELQRQVAVALRPSCCPSLCCPSMR